VTALFQLDEDVQRALASITQQSDSAALTYDQVVDTGPVWRTRSEPDVTSDAIQRMFDELSFYATADQVPIVRVSLLQGPDLQNILRQSYDNLTKMTKIRSTCD